MESSLKFNFLNFRVNSIYWILLLFSFFAIGFSFYQEIFYKISPCKLCIWQRNIYILIFLFSAIGLIFQDFKSVFFLIKSLFFAGFLIASYHSLVQLNILPDQCAVPNNIQSVDDFFDLLQNPQVSCAKIGWKFLGISIPVYNAIFSFMNCIGLTIYKSKI